MSITEFARQTYVVALIPFDIIDAVAKNLPDTLSISMPNDETDMSKIFKAAYSLMDTLDAVS